MTLPDPAGPDPAAPDPAATTVEAAEIARFGALADRWWDKRGPMRELHRMNPARIGWIAERLVPGVTVLDLGCGAGIAAEALARGGFVVTGVDASAEAIDAAERHRPDGAGGPCYRVGSAETLAAEAARFDAVTALEVIEHVTDPAGFVALAATLLVPGGLLFVSTLNRTARSWAAAKIGAEYVLRLLPVGTHQWRRFVTPVELAGWGRRAGLHLRETAGLVPTLPPARWRIGRDVGINYIAVLVRT